MATATAVEWALIAAIVITFIAFVVLIALPVMLSRALIGSAPAPLELPQLTTATANTTTPPPDGTWIPGSDSLAGFRVEESFLLQSGTIVGRTSAVTGSLIISHNEISWGSFQVDLREVTIGKQSAGFLEILDTNKYPNATLELTDTSNLTDIPTSGETTSSNTPGSLTMNGVTHPVTVSFTGRYDGTVIEAAGSASIVVSDWGIESPFAVHDTAVIEFLVVLRRE